MTPAPGNSENRRGALKLQIIQNLIRDRGSWGGRWSVSWHAVITLQCDELVVFMETMAINVSTGMATPRRTER